MELFPTCRGAHEANQVVKMLRECRKRRQGKKSLKVERLERWKFEPRGFRRF
jgi:hypothetical protein